MANEQSGTPLRRWRPFYGAFIAIDETIEAAGHPRAAFEDARVQIVKLLRAATDDGVAEQLCAALDDSMVEALQTLLVTPVPHGALAFTDLARAVGDLRNHGSPRIRKLAGDVVRGWTAGNVVTTNTITEELHKLPADEKQPIPSAKKMLPSVVDEAHKNKVLLPPTKMPPTAAMVSRANTSEAKKPPVDESKKMEAAKRKLQEGFDEAKRIKREHMIRKIDDKDARKLFEQKVEGKKHHIVRGRGLAAACRSRISSSVRRSLLPSLQMV